MYCFSCRRVLSQELQKIKVVVCGKCHSNGNYSSNFQKQDFVVEFRYGTARYDKGSNFFYAEEPHDEPTQLTQRRTGMNYSSAVFLINKNVRAIKCTYDAKDKSGTEPQGYTFKTLDGSIAPDDLVVVPTDTRHGFTVVKVSEVDIDVDLDSTIQLKWIVSKVDKVAYEKTLTDEAQAIKVIRMAEFANKRNALREGMLGANMDEIKALPIAALNGPTTVTKTDAS